jgi:hypothetical protein
MDAFFIRKQGRPFTPLGESTHTKAKQLNGAEHEQCRRAEFNRGMIQ